MRGEPPKDNVARSLPSNGQSGSNGAKPSGSNRPAGSAHTSPTDDPGTENGVTTEADTAGTGGDAAEGRSKVGTTEGKKPAGSDSVLDEGEPLRYALEMLPMAEGVPLSIGSRA